MCVFPEQVEVVDKVHAVGVACRQEPGVEVKQLTEALHTAAQSGCGAEDENSAVGLFEDVKEMNEISF